MEEVPPKVDNYFDQLHELYQNLKIVMRKWKPAEDEIHEPGQEAEKGNVELPDWVQAAQHLSASVLGGVDAKLEGLTPNDLYYYRLLGMKVSVMVDRSKILADLEREEESFKMLDDALALLVDSPPRPETTYMVLRLINHFGYVMSVEENFEKAREVLLEGERIYSLIGQDDMNVGFLASDDLFSDVSAPTPRPETTAYLEKLATNNIQMLGFVHGRLGDWFKFATCGHRALRRQLEGREGDALAWAARATRLALHFLTRNRYRDARTHLAAATHVLETYEADLRTVETDPQVEEKIQEVELRAADIGRAWTKYALQLLEASAPDDEDSSGESCLSSSSDEEDVADGEGGDGDNGTADEPKGWDKMVAAERKKEKSDRKRMQTLTLERIREQGDVEIEYIEGNDPNCTLPEGGDNSQQEEGEPIIIINQDPEAAASIDLNAYIPDDAPPDIMITVDGEVFDFRNMKKEIEENMENQEEKTNEEKKENEEDKENEKEKASEEKKDEEEKVNEDCCGLHVVDEDADEDEEDEGDSVDLTFPNLELDYIYEDVSYEPIESAEKARSLMHYVGAWHERVLRVYHVAKHPELHVAAVMDHAELLRYLASYAPMDAAYMLHRTRFFSLEEVCDSLKDTSPEVFSAASSELYRELADVQLEMMTLNLRRLDVANVEYECNDDRRQSPQAD